MLSLIWVCFDDLQTGLWRSVEPSIVGFNFFFINGHKDGDSMNVSLSIDTKFLFYHHSLHISMSRPLPLYERTLTLNRRCAPDWVL